MANKTIVALCLSILFFSALCSACNPCNPKYPPNCPPNCPRKEPPVNPFCPWDTLKLGACTDVLGNAVNLVIGEPLGSKCCALLEGLTDAEAAACLCTVIKESVLGITVKWSVAVSLLVSSCKKEIPDGFKCI